jgi:CRISPR-associated endoribonuclease Cas6
MRLKITLSAQHFPVTIPANYNHLLYAEIRSKIKKHGDIFAGDKRLRRLGILKDKFRIYTFSFLRFKNFMITDDAKIKINQPDDFNFFISSPIDSFIEGMAIAFLRDGDFKVGDVNFIVKSINKIDLPKFNTEMKLRLLSPIAVLRGKAPGKLFLTPDDPNYFERIKEDLIVKFNFLYNEKIEKVDFEMKFDEEYIKSRGGKFSKLIKFGRSNIKCFLVPFVIKTDPRLIKVGYEWGFGHKNHLGFGMAVIEESSVQS